VLTGYDVVGHVHGDVAPGMDVATGHLRREFLWENLVGGLFPMLDLAIASLATHSEIGLLMAEDPHLPGWQGTRPLAEKLAAQMGLTLFGDFLDFPSGGMFWARPAALRPFLALNLDDRDSLPALERLLPHAARCSGLGVGGLRAPGTNW
jgi:lipopolysaccharide biosynthesis protein